jgi:hypothetical protein
MHEPKKYMKRFWILKIIQKCSVVGGASVNAIWIINHIASVQGAALSLFIMMTWVFHLVL